MESVRIADSEESAISFVAILKHDTIATRTNETNYPPFAISKNTRQIGYP